ncbi:hypothetical protein HJG60_010052 [Phyllostomus discolor]|uniref:Uncharacterized protein n=1 Tax=Phyllostomus discolor TaxID=89673 RepID=A0A834B0X3_9CHIR|nr:hypothetical protein HJG60_010052 [Phyllostomus discolor]
MHRGALAMADSRSSHLEALRTSPTSQGCASVSSSLYQAPSPLVKETNKWQPSGESVSDGGRGIGQGPGRKRAWSSQSPQSAVYVALWVGPGQEYLLSAQTARVPLSCPHLHPTVCFSLQQPATVTLLSKTTGTLTPLCTLRQEGGVRPHSPRSLCPGPVPGDKDGASLTLQSSQQGQAGPKERTTPEMTLRPPLGSSLSDPASLTPRAGPR